MIAAKDAIRELHSATCAPCLGTKVKRAYFCATCFSYLPAHMRDALRQKVGQGYERAYEEAKRCIAQRRASAHAMAPGTDRAKIERRREHDALKREQAAKR